MVVFHSLIGIVEGLSIRVRLLRALPSRFKIDITVKPGSHQSELAGASIQETRNYFSLMFCVVNKQLNDKERVAAALENPVLVQTLEQSLANASLRGQPAED